MHAMRVSEEIRCEKLPPPREWVSESDSSGGTGGEMKKSKRSNVSPIISLEAAQRFLPSGTLKEICGLAKSIQQTVEEFLGEEEMEDAVN